MKMCPNTDTIGAVVSDLILANPLDSETVSSLLSAWYDHQILIFPDQPLTLDQLQAFTAQFGEFGADPFIAPIEGYPNVLELRREADETAVNFGGSWHSDWSFQDRPPSATILHAQIVPPKGGDTLFADAFGAYDTLSDDMKQSLVGLQAIHSARGPYGADGFYASEDNDRTMKILTGDEAHSTRTHPVVRTHPGSGRKALYVNKVYTIGIEDMDPAQSAALLEKLCDHAVQEQFVYRHQWGKDMLVMWDNRCTQHVALGGYDGFQRVMHRMTLQGEEPV